MFISGFALSQNSPLTELAALLRDDVTLSLKPDSILLNDEFTAGFWLGIIDWS